MGLRNLKRLTEQDGSMSAQLKQLTAQIDQANAELDKLKSSPGGAIADLEKQLSGIYKQIEDAKNARMEKEELEYFQGLVKKSGRNIRYYVGLCKPTRTDGKRRNHRRDFRTSFLY